MAHLHIFYNTRAHLKITIRTTWYGSVIKNIPANAGVAGDTGSIPGLERFQPEGGNGNPLQYSCQDNPMDRGAWQATVCGGHRVEHNWATEHACTHDTLITSLNSINMLQTTKNYMQQCTISRMPKERQLAEPTADKSSVSPTHHQYLQPPTHL